MSVFSRDGRSTLSRTSLPTLPAGRYGRRGPVFSSKPTGLRAVLKNPYLRHTDWLLVLAVLGLALAGTLLVWSATQPALAQAGANPRLYLDKQLLNVGIGLALMVATGLLDYRMIKVYAPAVYVITVLGLVAVLTPLGTVVSGAHAWISLPGGFQLEPSEFAKLGLVLVLAVVLGQIRGRTGPPKISQVLVAAACAIPVIALVAKEPALGVAIVVVVVLGGMIVLSGVKLRWLALFAVIAGGGGWLFFHLHLLAGYQKDRLTSFLHPGANTLGAGYSANQAKIMVGSGGMFGQGLFHGQLVAGSFVPNQQTDFIFTVAGEELGFVGAVAIVAVLGLVLLRAIRIAARADDMFGLLAASGIAIWFGIQAFVNIGMTIGIVPVTGIPLPFVSYGGSAMFADMMAIGVLQSIHRRHRLFLE